MRKVERIDEFCNELAKVWKENCPDWRFGQLISNVLDGKDPFYYEEDRMIKVFKEYFNDSNQ